MTCDGEGKLIESGQCESTLNGNPGCPLIDCLPEGMFFFSDQWFMGKYEKYILHVKYICYNVFYIVILITRRKMWQDVL